jgi:uncharacterized protein
MAAASEIEVVVSDPIIAEVFRVLSDKFTWSPDQLQQAERTIRRLSETVTPTEHLNAVVADPDDNRIIEAVVAGGCEAIITGDNDLLRLKEYAGIKMLRVSDFLDRGRAKDSRFIRLDLPRWGHRNPCAEVSSGSHLISSLSEVPLPSGHLSPCHGGAQCA